jgi:ribonuclease BN (tRNA processing enzyme)
MIRSYWSGRAAITVLLGLLVHATGASAQVPASASARTRVVMLGTGAPPADPDRFGPAVVVMVDSTPYLFDMGVGVVRRWAAALRANAIPLTPSSLRTAFVTHLHSDHTLGYAELILTSWTLERGPHRPLEIYGPKGLRAMTDHLLAAYAEDIAIRTGDSGDVADRVPPVVHVHEIPAGQVYRDALVTVTAFAVPHGSWANAFGYRIETPDRTIVLSGDTGPTSVVAEQCHGCDLLIHEGGSVRDADATPYFHRFHTTTEELARVARAAKPGLLILYHQRPASLETERAYATLRSLYPGAFVVARDLDVFR